MKMEKSVDKIDLFNEKNDENIKYINITDDFSSLSSNNNKEKDSFIIEKISDKSIRYKYVPAHCIEMISELGQIKYKRLDVKLQKDVIKEFNKKISEFTDKIVNLEFLEWVYLKI